MQAGARANEEERIMVRHAVISSVAVAALAWWPTGVCAEALIQPFVDEDAPRC